MLSRHEEMLLLLAMNENRLLVRCTPAQLALVLELVAKTASEQARDLALHVSRLSIKVNSWERILTSPLLISIHINAHQMFEVAVLICANTVEMRYSWEKRTV